MDIPEYWNRLEREASQIVQLTLSKCEREFCLITQAFDQYCSAFESIPPSSNGAAQIVRLALLSQNLNTFHVMINCASRGCYIQTLLPLRHVYEAWLSFWYLAKYPDEAQRWLDPTWKTRPPKAETMLNKIDHPSRHIKSKLKDFYEELNRFAHIDPAAVLSRLRHEDQTTSIGVGVRFDADDFRACTYGLSLWMGNSLDAISSLVPDGHQWHAKYQPVMEHILQFIDEYNAAHSGSPVSSDGDDPDAG
jgi:hypothetical protein